MDDVVGTPAQEETDRDDTLQLAPHVTRVPAPRNIEHAVERSEASWIGGRALGSCFDDPSTVTEVVRMGQEEPLKGLCHGADDEQAGHGLGLYSWTRGSGPGRENVV